MKKVGNKKRNKGLSKGQQQKLEDNVRKLIGKSYSDFEIEEELNLQPHVLRHYKKRIYSKDKIIFENLTPESVLADFAEKSKECIAQLETIIEEERRTGNNSQTQVQAIKLQHRFENKVIQHAQNLGLLTKRSRSLNIGGTEFQKHSMKDINAAVQLETELTLTDPIFEEKGV